MVRIPVWTEIYERMLAAYGPQHWWPGNSPFEVIVGAILTQSAAWTNVEKAIENLKASDALSPAAIRRLPQAELAELVYPSGYYNAKAKKLKAFADWLDVRFDDDLEAMASEDLDTLRAELLEVHGIGEETADDILLYALGKTAFVVDAFTRRLFSRLGLAPDQGDYSEYQAIFTANLPPDQEMFGEYHALVVRHAKDVCKKRPLCHGCCLLDLCPTGQRVARTP